jgi:hypothetical protein
MELSIDLLLDFIPTKQLHKKMHIHHHSPPFLFVRLLLAQQEEPPQEAELSFYLGTTLQ